MLQKILRFGFISTLIAGGVSLARLSEAFVELGPAGEVRFAGILFAATAAVLLRLALPAPTSIRFSFRLWLGLVLLLHGYVAAAWLWSDRTSFSSVQLYELALLCASLVVSVPLFRGDPAGSLRLLLLLFYGFGVAFVAASLAVLGAPSGELSALGAGGIGAARVLGMGIVSAALLATESGRRAWFLPAPFMLAGMLLSGSRAAVLALAVSLAFIWIRRAAIARSSRARTRPLRSLLYLGAGSLALAAVFATPSGRETLVASLVQLLWGAGEGSSQLYLADRDVIFADAWARFAANPAGGLGLGSYVGPFGEQYPHNLVLGFAVDAGAPALVLCVGLLIYALARVAASNSGSAQAALAGAIFFSAASLFAGSYYDARFVWIFLALGLMLREHAAAGPRAVRGVLELSAAPHPP